MRAVAITRCGMLRLRRPFIHPTMSDRHPTMTSQTTNRDLAEVVAAIRRGDQNLATDFAAQALRRGFEHPLIFLLEA